MSIADTIVIQLSERHAGMIHAALVAWADRCPANYEGAAMESLGAFSLAVGVATGSPPHGAGCMPPMPEHVVFSDSDNAEESAADLVVIGGGA